MSKQVRSIPDQGMFILPRQQGYSIRSLPIGLAEAVRFCLTWYSCSSQRPTYDVVYGVVSWMATLASMAAQPMQASTGFLDRAT